jgi:hypothetical protein
MSKLLVFGTEVEVEGEEEAERMGLFPQEEPYEIHGPVRTPIDTTALETAFLEHCLTHGWITVERHERGDCHFITTEGRKELARFGLTRFA